jgi:hypothetical protein
MVLDGQEAVIRIGDHLEDFLKDRVMAGNSCAALPVPPVTEVGTTEGGYFAVSQRARGELFDALRLITTRPGRGRRTAARCRQMGRSRQVGRLGQAGCWCRCRSWCR